MSLKNVVSLGLSALGWLYLILWVSGSHFWIWGVPDSVHCLQMGAFPKASCPQTKHWGAQVGHWAWFHLTTVICSFTKGLSNTGWDQEPDLQVFLVSLWELTHSWVWLSGWSSEVLKLLGYLLSLKEWFICVCKLFISVQDNTSHLYDTKVLSHKLSHLMWSSKQACEVCKNY